MKYRLLVTTFGLVFICLIGTGCIRKKNESQALSGRENVFKFILSDPVENLDPVNILYSSDGEVASLSYESLIILSARSNELEPLLAESWEKLENGKRYIFKIRQGIKFHNDPCFPGGNGRELSARDILFTFERIAYPKEETAGFSLFKGKIEGIDEYHSGTSQTISGIKVLDKYTIEFRLTKPFVTFLMCLSTPLTYIVPKEAINYYQENFGKHPVGTGPFRLAVWKPLQEMILVKNENYWQKDQNNHSLPYLDEIRIKLIPNTSLLSSELLKGENYLYFVDEQILSQLSRSNDFKSRYKLIELNNGLSVRFLGFSVDKKKSIINKAEIRKSIAFCYNIKNIFEDTLDNFIPAYSLVRKELLNGNQQNWYSYSPEEAKNIMRSISISNLNKHIHILSSIYPNDIREIKRAVEKAGLNATVEIEPIQYYNKIINERPDIFRVSTSFNYPDPEEYYALFYSKSGKSINLTGYQNTGYDSVFEKSMFEQNKDKRIILFLRLEEILKQDVPAIYISHEGLRYYIIPTFIDGLKIRYSNPDFRQVRIKTNNETED